MHEAFDCEACGETVREDVPKCPSCGQRLRYKTWKESRAWGGLGFFDMIPGIRDLPGPLRFALMVIVVAAAYFAFRQL